MADTTMVADGAWPSIGPSAVPMDDPLLRAVLEYWHELRGERAMPRRREIDPVLLPRRTLPHLLILRVDGHGFRYGLVGTAIELQFGMSIAGHRPEDLPFAPDCEAIVTQHRETAETQRPTYREDEFTDWNQQARHCRRLLLPLSDDGTTVTDLFGIWLFLRKRPSGA